MKLKRFLTALLITLSIPLFFFIAIAYGQHSWVVNLWTEFYKGLMIGIATFSLPFGALLSWNLFKPAKLNNKYGGEKRYSS